ARSSFVKDQRPTGYLLQTCSRQMFGASLRMRDQQQGIIAETYGFDLGMVQRASQADFCLFAQHHIQNLFRMARANADDDVGVSTLKAFQNVRQKVDGDRKGSGNLQRSAACRLRVMDSLPGHRGGAQEQFGMRTKRAPGVGNDQAASGTRKQLYR